MVSNLIIFLLGLAFAVGNVIKPSWIRPDIRFSIMDLSILMIYLIYVFKRFPGFKLILEKYRLLIVSVIMFIVISTISLIPAIFRYGAVPVFVGFLYLLRWSAYSLLFIPFLGLLTGHKIKSLSVALCLVIVGTGILQYLFFPDIRPLTVNEWDMHYFRVVGPFLDPGFFGFLLFYVISVSQRTYLLWFLTYIVFAFTYSRSSFLALLSASAFISAKLKQPLYFIIASILILVTVLTLPRQSDGEGVKLERTSSIQARIDNWLQSGSIFVRNSVLGVGFNVYRYAKMEYGFSGKDKWLVSHADAGADSSLLFVAATTGIIGLGVYIYYLRSLWLYFPQNIFSKSILVGLFFHSFFLNSFFYPPIILLISLELAKAYKQP